MTTVSHRRLSHREAAAEIGITPGTLRFWRCKGKGPRFIKLGPTKQAGVAYDSADIEAWLEERKFASTSAYAPAALVSASKRPTQSASAIPIPAPWLRSTV